MASVTIDNIPNRPEALRLTAKYIGDYADLIEMFSAEEASLVHVEMTGETTSASVTTVPAPAPVQRRTRRTRQADPLVHPVTTTEVVIPDPHQIADEIIANMQGAKTLEALDAILTSSGNTLQSIGSAESDRVTVAYGDLIAGFVNTDEVQDPPPEDPPESLTAEVGVDGPPTDPEKLAETLKEMMKAYMTKIGYAKAVPMMKEYGADRFSGIDRKHHLAIWERLTKELA